MLAGRFSLLGREVDFGSVEAVQWRCDLNEGNNALWRMTLGYFGYAPPLLASGSESALHAIADMVRSLETQNPFTAVGVFRDIWNPYCASHRIINLLTGLWLFEQAAPSDSERSRVDRQELLRHARFCAVFVRRNLERDLRYNHLLKDYVALLTYAAAAGTVPAEWRSSCTPPCRPVIAAQVLSDGGHAERCPMYHVLSMLDLMLLADAGVLAEASAAQVRTQLTRMRRALPVMIHPDGDIALFSDSWLGEAPAAADVLGEPSPVGNGVALVLPASGYVQLRAEDAAAIFDCGACGPDDNPAHAHADFLAVELSIAGRRFPRRLWSSNVYGRHFARSVALRSNAQWTALRIR